MSLKSSMPVQAIPLLAGEIVLVSGCYLAGVYWAGRSFYEPAFVTEFLWNDNGLVRLLLLIASVVAALYLTDRQLGWQPQPAIKLFQQVCLAVGMAFVAQAFIGYTISSLMVPRYVMMLGSLIVLIAIPLFRRIYPAYRPSAE